MNQPDSNIGRSFLTTVGRAIAELAAAFLRDPKIRKFTLYGAVGCLLGAVLGELLFLVKPTQDICIVIDASGSMGGEKLTEVKRAAAGFVQRQSSSPNRISIVQFGSSATTLIPLSRDKADILAAIDRVRDGGSTNMEAAIRTGAAALAGADDSVRRRLGGSAPYLLLFTDGAPDNGRDTLSAARDSLGKGIKIIAIGTGDADTRFLAEVTNDPKVVFAASAGQFDEGFRSAEQAIGSLAASGGSGQGIIGSLVVTAIWTALLAAGCAIALTVGQNIYLGKKPAEVNEILWLIGASMLAGIVAGGIAQAIYSVTVIGSMTTVVGPVAMMVGAASRLAGWTILGGLVGRGLAFFVPNLRADRAWLGGAAGGFTAALAFLAVSLLGDALGRLVGAAILGGLIGMMLAFVEAQCRAAWLEVERRAGERVVINLGVEPVKVGSNGRACAVYAQQARAVEAAYTFIDGKIRMTDYATEATLDVVPGSTRMFGDVRVTVKTATDGTASIADPGVQAISAKPAAPPQPPPAAPRPSPPPPHSAPGGVARTPATLRGATTPTLSSPAMRPPPPPPPPKKP
jgi:Ca-activated chloride channel family protein